MIRYSINNRLAGTQQPLITTFKTIQALYATTGNLCRGELVDFSFGPDGAPSTTDCQIVYDISRMTIDGTSTGSPTPNPLDGSSVASTSARVNYTAEPTVTGASSLYMLPLNQRASLRMFLDVGFRWPAVAISGLVVRAMSPTASGYANPVGVTTLFQE